MGYEVLDQDIDTRPPDIEGPGLLLLEVVKTQCFPTQEHGQLFVVEFIVLESDSKKTPVGTRRAYKVFDCFGEVKPKQKELNLRKMRALLSALAGVDPDSKQKWGETAKYAGAKNIFGQNVQGASGVLRGGRGVILRAVAKEPKLSRKGNLYTEVIFERPAPAAE